MGPDQPVTFGLGPEVLQLHLLLAGSALVMDTIPEISWDCGSRSVAAEYRYEQSPKAVVSYGLPAQAG